MSANLPIRTQIEGLDTSLNGITNEVVRQVTEAYNQSMNYIYTIAKQEGKEVKIAEMSFKVDPQTWSSGDGQADRIYKPMIQCLNNTCELTGIDTRFEIRDGHIICNFNKGDGNGTDAKQDG